MEENKKLRPKRRRLPTRTKFDPTSHRPVSPSVVPGMDVWTSPSTPNALEEHDQDPSPVTVGTPNRDPSMTPRTMQRHRQRLANITERLKSLAAEKDDNDSGLDLSSHIVLPRNLEELFKGNGRTYRTIKESSLGLDKTDVQVVIADQVLPERRKIQIPLSDRIARILQEVKGRSDREEDLGRSRKERLEQRMKAPVTKRIPPFQEPEWRVEPIH